MAAYHNTGVMKIADPTFKIVSGIEDANLLGLREVWLGKLCVAFDRKNSDAIKQAMLWVVMLTKEMEARGARVSTG